MYDTVELLFSGHHRDSAGWAVLLREGTLIQRYVDLHIHS